jgi:hypothetical protein
MYTIKTVPNVKTGVNVQLNSWRKYFSEILNRETEGLDMEEILINTEVADPNFMFQHMQKL